jgi:hypothetical protein
MTKSGQGRTAYGERLNYAQLDGEPVEARVDRMARRPVSMREGNGMRPNSARTGAMQAEAGRIAQEYDLPMPQTLIEMQDEATEVLDDRTRGNR